MRSVISFIGVLLIIAGIFALAYQGISYTREEKVAQIGDVKLTAEHQKTIYFPPVLGGLSLVAGVVLVLVGRKSSKM